MTNVRAKLSNKSKSIFPSNYKQSLKHFKNMQKGECFFITIIFFIWFTSLKWFGCGYTSVSARLEHWDINIPQWCLVLSTRIIFYCRKWAYHPLIVKQINETIISRTRGYHSSEKSIFASLIRRLVAISLQARAREYISVAITDLRQAKKWSTTVSSTRRCSTILFGESLASSTLRYRATVEPLSFFKPKGSLTQSEGLKEPLQRSDYPWEQNFDVEHLFFYD